MRTVHVTRSIPAPAERVFDLLADHANYDRFRGVRGSELMREGEPPPNGVGALRKVLIGPLRFEEEITAYERPSRLEYLIVRINAPYEHDGGTIRLAEKSGWTKVEWTSVFRVPTRLVGGVQERAWAYALGRGFGRVLEDVERMLREGGVAP
jgi:uncharacterized protein YndB with AHSA1/START domain